MGASVSVYGVREPEGKLGSMVDMVIQCKDLDITIPPEVEDYFEGTDATHMRTREEMIREATETSLKYGFHSIDGLTEGDVEYDNGMLVDLSKLPEDIKFLRISMS